jgi:hypothetical protein
MKTKEDTALLAKVTGYTPSYEKKKSRLTRAEIVKLLEEAKAGMISAANNLGIDIDFEDEEDPYWPDSEVTQWVTEIAIYADELKVYNKALLVLDARAAKKTLTKLDAQAKTKVAA